MFASWPMVFGALTAGVIAGFLIPENGPAPSPGSVAAVSDKAVADKARDASTTAPKAKPAAATPAPAVATPVSAKTPVRDEACENQTWPYLTPSCLDRSARNPAPAVVVKTRIAEPPAADSAGVKQKTEPANSAPAAATATAAKDAAPAKTDDAARAQKMSGEMPGRQAAEEPEASDEAVQSRAKARTARRAAEPRRPAARRPSERRYAGPEIEGQQRPYYIERGGRLYLAPEQHYRLRPQAGYWREW